MRITGGIPVGGNLNYMAANNPLLDPRFKIQGGEPWNPTPLLPGKETKEFEQREFNLPAQPMLPAAGVGNVGGMLAQTTPFYGDTLNMGPAEGDYSNMPVVPDAEEEKFQYDQLMEQYRNQLFPPTQIPAGFAGRYIT